MEIPDYEPFYLDTLSQLRAEIARLGLDLPVRENLNPLRTARPIGSKQAANRFCLQPMTGLDAQADGSPSELTKRRYARYAEGGFALLWVESTIAGPADGSGRLAINESSVTAIRTWLEELRTTARERWQHEVVVVLQLSAAICGQVQPPPENRSASELISDDEIERGRNQLITSATLAAEAGFDGIDVQSCHGALAGQLLAAFQRKGNYGGSLENRSRFLRQTFTGIRNATPDLLLATRLSAFDAVRHPHGFGVDETDYRKFDLTEPIRLISELRELGLDLLNITASSPNLRTGSASERPFRSRSDCSPPDEHPLMTLDRQLQIAAALRASVPGLPVVGSGFSWLRHFVPQVAATAIDDGTIDFVGLARSAMADPEIPAAVLGGGMMNRDSACMVCYACSQLLDKGGPVGCPIRDSEVYGETRQGPRRILPEQLEEEARRCHFCEAAPCTAACPAHTDIPAFIKAWLEGDDRRAYDTIHSSDLLPEMTSHLSPSWLQSEGACIETALTGSPVPILSLQHAIARQAREQGESGVVLPDIVSGKTVAVVGGGPCGIAAAARLLELGHEVDLYEHSDQLGGTPQRVIPTTRAPDFRNEIDALLDRAVEAGRLKTHFGKSLGRELDFASLHGSADAVLLAAGLWQERSMGAKNHPIDGVVDALSFLEAVKTGSVTEVPEKVAVLSGGDSAMDAADIAQRLGAQKIFIIFGGPRSMMHWHRPEEWFQSPGVHPMMERQPLGYESDRDEKLTGLRLHHTDSGEESTLAVDLAIEAMGLEIDSNLAATLANQDLAFTADGLVEVSDSFRTQVEHVYAAGGMTNGGASVGQCVAEGMKAAKVIHADLS